jgi:hypothetical protein
MKNKIAVVLVIALLMLSVGTIVASAQAYATAFTTSITYQNVGTAATTGLQILFYASPTTTTPIPIDRPNLAAKAGTSLFIGSLTEITPGFEGTALLQADQPIVATLVQLPQGSATVKNRPLSNGFSSGAPTALIATVLKNQFNTNSIFSVQNTDTELNTVTVTFYDTSAAEIDTITQDLESGAGFYVDAGLEAGLNASFNGSAVVTAERADTSDGSIIASVMELGTNTVNASAFEGVSAGGTTYYMPSALCAAFGGTFTSYAVQNTSLTTSTNVTVEYSNGATQTQAIGAGAKKSFIACDATGMTTNFNGSATVTSDTTAVIAIGKAYGLGLSTAFIGASTGAEEIALPYVRWASDANWAAGTQQRVNLTIQNIGSTDIPANSIIVQYVDKFGVVVGTHTLSSVLAAGAKLNSNASNAGLTEFGVYGDGTFGGGVIVIGPAGSQLAVVARVSTQVSAGAFASEDYNGQPVP